MVSDERTQLTQLSEEENTRQTLHKGRHRREAEAIVAQAVSWLGSGSFAWRAVSLLARVQQKFHTIRWRGPAAVIAVQRDPDSGQVACYWLAHGTVLIRAGRQHVKRLLDSEGRMASSEEALQVLRQRRVVRMLDLDKVNRHQIDRLDPHEDLDNTDGVSPSGTQLM